MLKKIIKPMSVFLIFSFLLLDFSVQTATAQMIGTNAVIAAQKQEANRERVTAFLSRDDVQQVMVRHGVDAAEAQKRVASLSNSELTKISQAMEQLPAGGDGGIGTIVVASVFIFVVLLITDLAGLTHIFPFVNHRR
ncbi:MAG: PA2779 family protein [Desulfuromonadaceae bacterium]|nr:PA2779 family protein [Desulfuromonadaceae bacterium]